MSKLDIATVYRDRIEQIKIDIKLAVRSRNWDKKWQLMKEKANLEQKIEEMRGKNERIN